MANSKSISIKQIDKLNDHLRWAHGVCSVLCCVPPIASTYRRSVETRRSVRFLVLGVGCDRPHSHGSTISGFARSKL